MASEPYFRIANPALLRSAQAKSGEDCSGRQDAPVCVNGEEDVTCTGEIYRGCQVGQTDCADGQGQDDNCCAGTLPFTPGDNIDHAYCRMDDAEWGGIQDIWCFSSYDTHRPPTI
jgi:hypothetical protein